MVFTKSQTEQREYRLQYVARTVAHMTNAVYAE